ncbi:hypothetical protein [Microbacterium sp. UNCCL10]|nr:hypothetical protein [Microbacterium sp. UNCCL10]
MDYDQDNSIHDSANDNSVNAGIREYGNMFSGAAAGAPLAGLGTVSGGMSVSSNATVIDQSVNANVNAGGDVGLESASSAIAATAPNANAAGGDIVFDSSVDNSVDYTIGGDAHIGNTTTIENTFGSYNSAVDNSTTDNSLHTEIMDSFNHELTNTLGSYNTDNSSVDESVTTTISETFNDSFNEEFAPTMTNTQSWNDESSSIWTSGDDADIVDGGATNTETDVDTF